MTIEFQCEKPSVEIFSGLRSAYIALMSPTAFKRLGGDEIARNAVDAGAGPLKSVGWDSDETIILQRNRNYNHGVVFNNK